MKQFVEDLAKLMEESDRNHLSVAYTGKRKASAGTSKGHLARIMESYCVSDEEEADRHKQAAIVIDRTAVGVPKMSHANT